MEQGFHNHGEKNQRLNYDLGELDVVKEVARTPNKVLLLLGFVCFVKSSLLCVFLTFLRSLPGLPGLEKSPPEDSI